MPVISRPGRAAAQAAASSTMPAGLGAGRLVRPEAALQRMVDNQRRADRLVNTGEYSGADESFLTQVKNTGLNVFDKSGLDSVLMFFDRARKTVNLAKQDNPFINQLVSGGIMGAAKAGQMLFGKEQLLTGADTQAGYEIKPSDYFDIIRGRTEDVATRMDEKGGVGTADVLLGEMRDISASAINDAYGTFPSDFNENWMSWDIPGLGIIDPKSLGDYTRFAAMLSEDMAADPLTYVTGGLGGLGRTTARTAISASLRGSMGRTTKLVIDWGSDAASSLKKLELAVKAKTLTPLDEYASRKMILEADKLMKSGVVKEWDEAVEQAAGMRRFTEIYPPGKDKPIRIPLKDGDFNIGKGVYADMNDSLAKVIETKAFDSTDDLWKAWKSYTKANPRLSYTTGGLRAGIGFSSFEVPLVTNKTRGLQRKVQRLVTQSKAAKRIYDKPGWAARQEKWTQWRSKVSREAPEAIAAAGGRKGTYQAYLTQREAPLRALAALGLDDYAEKGIALSASWKSLELRVMKQLGDDDGVKFMDSISRAIGSGDVPDTSLIRGNQKLVDDIVKVAEQGDKTYREMTEVLRRVDPEMAKHLIDGGFRPLSFSEDFATSLQDFSALTRIALPDLRSNADRIAFAKELSEATGEEITTRDVDLFLNTLDTFGNSAKRTRPFGDTAELRWRKLGRHTQLIDDEVRVAFDSLDDINTSLTRTFNAVADKYDFESAALKRMRAEEGFAIELHPVKQMERYLNDMQQAVAERTIVGEAIAFNLVGVKTTVLDVDATMALLVEEKILTEAQAQALVLTDVLDHQALHQKTMLINVTERNLPGSRHSLSVADVLANDEDYARYLDALTEHWETARRTNAAFPHAYENEVDRLMAQLGETGKKMSRAEAESQASTRLYGLQELIDEQAPLVHQILARHRMEIAGLYRAAGFTDTDELVQAVTDYYGKLAARANETMAQYQTAYERQFSKRAGKPSIDLMGVSEFDSVLENIGEAGGRRAENIVAAVRETAEASARRSEAAERAGVHFGEMELIRDEARTAELISEVTEAALDGREVTSHHVASVTLPDTPSAAIIAARINDPNVTVGKHFTTTTEATGASKATRLSRIKEADTAVFFYHPSYTQPGDMAFRLLRHRVTGESLTNKVLSADDWFRQNMTEISTGVFVPSNKEASSVVVLANMPESPKAQSDMVNWVHRELTRRSDELGRELDIVVEMPDSVRKGYVMNKIRSVKSPEDIVDRKVLANYPGVSKDELVQQIIHINSDKLQMYRRDITDVGGAPWYSQDAVRAQEAVLAGFWWDDDAGRWLPRSLDEGRIIETRVGKPDVEIVIADKYPVLRLTEADIDGLSTTYPTSLVDDRMRDFEAQDLPDAPTQATRAEEKAAASPGARRVDEGERALREHKDEVEAEIDRLMDQIDAAPTEELKDAIRQNELYQAEAEIQRIDQTVQAQMDSAETFGAPAAKGTSKTPNLIFDEATDDAAFEGAVSPGFDRAGKLPVIQQQLIDDLTTLGVEELTAQNISYTYIAQLAAARPSRDMAENMMALADLPRIIAQEQSEVVDTFVSRFPRQIANEDVSRMFPPGTKIEMPEYRTVLENRRRFGFTEPSPELVEVQDAMEANVAKRARIRGEADKALRQAKTADERTNLVLRRNVEVQALNDEWERLAVQQRELRPAASEIVDALVEQRKVAGVQTNVERSVLKSRKLSGAKEYRARDIRNKWADPVEISAELDDFGPMHTRSQSGLQQEARRYEQAGMAGRETWYDPDTHIVITAKKDGKPAGAVNVGRGGGTINDDGFGNPFKVEPYRPEGTKPFVPKEGEVVVGTTGMAVKRYEELLWKRIAEDADFADRVADLSGRTLWYYRKDGRSLATHSEPLADAADYLKSRGYGTKGKAVDQAAPDAPVPTRTPVEQPQTPNRRPIVAPLDEQQVAEMDETQLRKWFEEKELQEKSLYGKDDTWDESIFQDRDSQELGVDPPAILGEEETMARKYTEEGAATMERGDELARRNEKAKSIDWLDVQKQGVGEHAPNREEYFARGYDELIASQDMETFASEAVGRIFGRSTRSAPDRLADGHLEAVTRIVKQGTTDIYQEELPARAMHAALGAHSVDEQSVANLIRRLEAGDLDVILDPTFQRAMVIAHDYHEWRLFPELYENRHGVPPPTSYPGLSDDILVDMAEQLENEISSTIALRQIGREPQMIAQQVDATNTEGLVNVMRRLRDTSKIQNLDERMRETTKLLDEIGESKDGLEQAVRTVYGDDASLTVIRDTGDGPALVVSFPYSDQIALETQFEGSFGKALQAMIDGDLSVGDAYAADLSTVAKAYEARLALDDILDHQSKAYSVVEEVARKENVRDYFNNVVGEAQSAIDRRNAQKLRGLVARRTSSGVYERTPQYKELVDALSGAPEQQEFVARLIETAWVADLEEWPSDEAFRAWWMQERQQVASLTWSMEQNIAGINRETRKMIEHELAMFPPDEAANMAKLTEEMLLTLTQIQDQFVRTGKHMNDPQYRAAVDPDVGTMQTRTAAATAASKFNARRQVQPTVLAAQLDRVDQLLDQRINAMEKITIPFDSKAAEIASIDKARALHKRLRDAMTNPSITTDLPPPGMLMATDLGLDAGLLAGRAVDPIYASLLEATVNNSQNLFTPYVISEIQRTGRNLQNWWKAAATVSRPSFHIRNMIGGIANGFIVGVGPMDYKRITADVLTFRKRLRRLTTLGADQVGDDVFEREVIKHLSKQNQDVFRQAWKDRVLQTSFTRAEELYTPGGKMTWKPWERNFAGFQLGGRTMESMEDWLRMGAFAKHYTEQMARGGDVSAATKYAHQIVNTVHFDYTALTPLEENIKKFVPFYVWTRRNVPLQMRVLMQNPTFMLWYQRGRSNWNDQQLSQMDASADPFLRYQASKGFLMPVVRDNDEGWARMLWSPQLPMLDLDNLPLWDTDGGPIPINVGSAFNAAAWASFVVDNLGPGLSVPFAAAQAGEDTGTTNAKAGMNAVIAALDRIPGINQFTPDSNPSPNASFAPDNDYRISKWASELFNTAVPFYDDYRAMLGVRPNTPYRAASEGWLPGEDPGMIGGLITRAALGPMGRTFGRGFGFAWTSPTDAMFSSYDVSRKLTDMETAWRFRQGYEEDGDKPTAEELMGKLGFDS